MPSIKYYGIVGGKVRRIVEQMPANLGTLRDGIKWLADKYHLNMEEIETGYLIIMDSLVVHSIDEAPPMQPDSKIRIITVVYGG